MAELTVADEPGWMGTPRWKRHAYEYARVPWDEVNEYGAEGWRLTAVPPMQEVKMTLGQATPGEVVFVMERET